MRRVIHGSWISVLALALLAVGAAWWAGWTESGLQRLAALASRQLGPVRLQIIGVRGTLAAGFHADEVIVEHRRARVDVTGIDGRIAMLPLLWQSIHVRDLQLHHAEVDVPAALPDKKPWTPHILVGLLTIRVDHLHADEAVVIVPSRRRLEASNVNVVAALGLRDVRVYDGTLQLAGIDLKTSGNLHAAEPIQIRATTRVSRERAGAVPWLADVQFDGNLERLPLSGEFHQPFTAGFDGVAHSLTGDWYWEGNSKVHAFDLRAFGAGGALGVLDSTLHGRFGREGITAQGEVNVPGLHTATLALQLESGFATRGLDIHRLVIHDPRSGTQLAAHGTVTGGSGPLRLALAGSWQDFRWPLADRDAPVGSPKGDFTLEGDWPYRLKGEGLLRIAGLAPIPGRADTLIEHAQLRADSITLGAWGAEARLHGTVDWAQQWQLAGTVQHLDVAALRPGIPGRLTFNVEANGRGTALRGRADGLSGQVRGQAASGHAGFGYADGDWRLEHVQLQLGRTRIELDGHAGQRLDLQYLVDAGDLGLLAAGASGRLHAVGRVRGDAASPLLLATLDGSAIRWQGLTLQKLAGNVDFDPRGSGHAESQLLLEQLQWQGRQVDRLRIASTGTAGAHRFTVELRSPSLVVVAGGQGHYADATWHGQLERLDAGDGAGIELALESPAALVAALDGSDLELGSLCLRDAQSRLCAFGQQLAGRRQFSVNISNVPLRTLTAGLLADTDFIGTVTLDAHGEAAPGAPWVGQGQATLAGASARHHLLGGRTEAFELGDGELHAAFGPEGLRAGASLKAGALANLAADLQAQVASDDWHDWPIKGQLRLQTQALGFIDSYAAQVDRVSGKLAAELGVTGTLGAPVLEGQLQVSDAQVDAYAVNLAMRDLNFTARLHDSTLQLDGSARAGADGSAKFDGTLQWRESLPWGLLHLKGDNLRVVNLPEARVQASPDVEVRFSGRRIDVTGTVALPYARLERPDQLTNAVRASADEVLVGAHEAPPSEPFQVFSDITLKLGERVTIDTLGLAGRLSGSLRTVTDDTGFNHGTGELQVEEGKYTAYGRKLDIEHGKLQFSNGPLGDPAIDLRAVKKFPDITAGVNVRGTLRAPRMTFFSDPPVAQSQIVSLLLAGGSLDSVQNSSDPAARNKLLLQQGSAMLFQQFGNRVGIDDVSVESNLNNDTSLVLGRYLSPRLYVSYGIGLAEAINTIKMRYTIGDHWTIKTEAGTARSADLVYTIEH
jgi:translocation and assembly module TamB